MSRRSTKAVWGILLITKNTLCGSKLYIFILCQKSLDIKIMFREDIPIVNISKKIFCLVICIAKNLI